MFDQVNFSSTEEHSQQVQNQLPLLVGSVMGGAAFLLVVAAIVVVVVFRRWGPSAEVAGPRGRRSAQLTAFFLLCLSKRRASPYSDRLQRYISNRGEETVVC